MLPQLTLLIRQANAKLKSAFLEMIAKLTPLNHLHVRNLRKWSPAYDAQTVQTEGADPEVIRANQKTMATWPCRRCTYIEWRYINSKHLLPNHLDWEEFCAAVHKNFGIHVARTTCDVGWKLISHDEELASN